MIPQNLTMLRRHKVRLFFFLKNFIRGIILFAIAILFYKLIFRYIDLSDSENIFSFDVSTSVVSGVVASVVDGAS